MRARTQLDDRRLQPILCVVLVLTLAAASPAFAQQSAEQLLQSGLYQEDVKGDLDEAIKVYEGILEKFPENRPVAAKALLHIGLCCEKMGETAARNHYQRLIKDYGDQLEFVAHARSRLSNLGAGADGAASAMSTRQVWTAPKHRLGRPSPDGRYISFYTKYDLGVYDIQTGESRILTDEGYQDWETTGTFLNGEWPAEHIWSPDSRHLVYDWAILKDREFQPFELRIVDINGSKPRVLYTSSDWLLPRALSQDGKHILAAHYERNEGGGIGHGQHIVWLSVADGSRRVLKSLEGAHVHCSLSPDGRYVVYEHEQDIHLVAVDGSREIPLVKEQTLNQTPFWTPDGKGIVFVSDRSGSQALWILEVDEGKPKGAPTLLREVTAAFRPIGFSGDGSLYYTSSAPGKNFDTYVATLDFEAGKVLAPPVKVSSLFDGGAYPPFWSPDGKHLAYGDKSRGSIRILSVETREERELKVDMFTFPKVGPLSRARWSPDGGSILIIGVDRQRGIGIFRVDVETGHCTHVLQSEPWRDMVKKRKALWRPELNGPVFSNDGKRIYGSRPSDRRKNMGCPILAYDLETHRETELYRTNNNLGGLALSPDGRRLAFYEHEGVPTPPGSWPSEGPFAVKTLSTSGGEPRKLYTLETGELASRPIWMPDGSNVVILGPRDSDKPDKPDELWVIPAEGGEPRKVNLGVKVSHVSLHPDGRRIAFIRREQEPNAEEVWVLENFLPASSTGE